MPFRDGLNIEIQQADNADAVNSKFKTLRTQAGGRLKKGTLSAHITFHDGKLKMAF